DFAFTKQVVYDPPLVPAITMCDDDDCSAHIEVKGIGLTPKSPNRIEATLKLLVESRDASGPPGQKKTWDGTCDLNVDTTKGTRNYIGVKAEIALEAETQPARQGYTYARIVSIGEDPAEKIEAADLAVSGGFIGACSLLNFDTLKGWILNLVLDPVTDMLTGVLDDQLCTTPGLHGCPQGTFAVGAGEEAVCRYSNSESARCVPLLLGYEGQGNLGASLLGGFSPGTDGSAQFVVASGGAAEAVSQGLSLFFYGGLRSMDPTLTSSPAHASCVPTRPVPPIPTVPRAATFRGNVLPGSNTTTHVGIGISEQFLNYASYGLYDSGMLCLGVGTRVSQQISAGLFSLLLQSLKNLTFPENNAPLSIVLRPSQEPSFEVGKGTDSDPLLLMTLKGVSADFYLFTQERYVRFMTFSGDLHVSLNLEVQGSELTIAIGGVTTENASVTNSELLAEDPGVLSGLIEDVLTSFASQLASTIPPITLPSFAGFSLDVPDNGVTGVEDTGEEFVAIFANLMLDPNAVTSLAETDATLVRLDADADSLRLENLGKSAPPTAWIDASATGRLDAAFEYSYRVDGGAWSRWQADPRLAVSDRRLELQATHRVEVRSRVAGEPRTTDLTPAALDVVVDVLPPVVHAARRDDTVLITA
ncbi:MAG: hypothetical protein KC417_17125, partial [Myxococcales bacterium]|nr:hypothetical protein [Myxococcales bacterium]